MILGSLAAAALSFVAHAAAVDQRIAAAASAAGCAIDADAPYAKDLAALPDQAKSSLEVVATLSGGADADSLGRLCVGVVQESGVRFARVATLREDKWPEPPSEVDPVTTTYVGIDKTAFRFTPGQAAFGVRVTGEFNSTSTDASWSALYLFRRDRERVTPIFHTRIDDSTIDKTDGAGETRKARLVRFTSATHNGAYDLVVADRWGRHARRFVWTGLRYRAAPER